MFSRETVKLGVLVFGIGMALILPGTYSSKTAEPEVFSNPPIVQVDTLHTETG